MSRLLYDNRRLLVLAIALIAVSGLSSFFILPRMEDPILSQRMAIINTIYPGATPERVEALVTEVIEEELEEITEVKELRSTSRSGVSSITIELRDDIYNVDPIWSRVRDEIDDAQALLPAEVLDPDFEILQVTAYASVVALVWEGEGEPNYAVLRRMAEELEQRLRAVRGTREVDTFGDPEEEITIEVDLAELATLGLTAADVAWQVEASDAKAAAGLLRTPSGNLTIEVDSELDTVRRIASTPIRYSATDDANDAAGRFVTLGAVADVRKGIRDPSPRLAIVEGKRAVALAVLVRGDLRVDLWHHAAREVIDEFASELPPAVSLQTVFEQNEYVAERLSTLLLNLLVGATAVMVVVWVMMGWRSALVVGSALPLASLMVLTGKAD